MQAPPRAADPRELERSIGAHLGVSFPIAVVRSRLERAEAALRDAVKSLSTGLSPDDVRKAERSAEGMLLGAEACGKPASRIRSALPSPERAAACAVVHRAGGDLSARIAMHDDVTVALWAVLVRGEGADPDEAQAKHHLLAAVPPERSVRLVRFAAVRPAAAIGAGLAVEMLASHGIDRVRRAAEAWADFGDAPFDVVEREVFAKLP
jgi:hypothetical protein